MINKPTIIFAFPFCQGGVASFNFNILNYSKLKTNFYTKVILIKEIEDSRSPFLDTFLADEVINFNYSRKDNKYYVEKRLNQILDLNEGAIVTDNALTICAARRFNNPKTIFHLLHDFFYVNQHIQLEDYIDNAVAHSSFFTDAIFSSNPIKWMNHSFYLPYGVQKQEIDLSCKNNTRLNLVFLGRLEKSKGVLSLIEIEKKLEAQNVNVNWTIIGKGVCKEELVNQWIDKQNCNFFEPVNTIEVFNILHNQDIFVFPTNFEGTPVSILESIACGVVPIVNDLPGGIRDIVLAEIGFRCTLNNLDEFVNTIKLLDKDRNLLSIMQHSCMQHSEDFFEIKKNADAYFELFSKYSILKDSSSITSNIMLSRLDRPYIPNFITQFFRNLK